MRKPAGRTDPQVRLAIPAWVAPLVAALTITTVYPGIFLIALAVTDSRLGKPFRAFSGFEESRGQLQRSAVPGGSGAQRRLCGRVAASCSWRSASPIALLLSALVKSGRFLMSLILLPLMTPPVMVGIAWKLILAPAGGLLNGVLMHTRDHRCADLLPGHGRACLAFGR